MTVTYILKKDIVARTAIQLSFLLNEMKDSIFIIKNNRCFNGKSLIGILSNNLKKDDTIQIKSSKENIFKIKEIFKDLGKEVK